MEKGIFHVQLTVESIGKDGEELDNWGQQILHKNLDVGTNETNRTDKQ